MVRYLIYAIIGHVAYINPLFRGRRSINVVYPDAVFNDHFAVYHLSDDVTRHLSILHHHCIRIPHGVSQGLAAFHLVFGQFQAGLGEDLFFPFDIVIFIICDHNVHSLFLPAFCLFTKYCRAWQWRRLPGPTMACLLPAGRRAHRQRCRRPAKCLQWPAAAVPCPPPPLWFPN